MSLEQILADNGLMLNDFNEAKALYERELNTVTNGLQNRRIIKLAKLLKQYDKVSLRVNCNLRFDKARKRKAVKIGQTNDMIKGYPKSIIWAVIEEKAQINQAHN